MFLKKKSLLIILWVFIFSMIAQSQRRFQDTDRQIERFNFAKSVFFNFDVFPFSTASPDSFLVYVSVSLINDLLQFVKQTEEKYIANFEISLSFLTDSELAASEIFRKKIIVDNYQSTNSRSLVHSYYHIFQLKNGNYKLLIELTDLDTKKSMRREKEFELPDLPKKEFTLFQPIILSRLKLNMMTFEAFDKTKTNLAPAIFNDSTIIVSPFKINELEQYRIVSPVIVYHEIHKQQAIDSLQVEYLLINKDNQIKWQNVTEIHEPNKSRIQRSVELDPAEHEPDFYTFKIIVHHQKKTQSVQVPIHFNPRKAHNAEQLSENSFEIDEFGPLKYVIEKKEYENLASLEQQERRAALEKFWKERSPSGALRDEFIRRVRFSNQNFISLVEKNKGWQTDQGRVYIIYGPADEILHPQSPDSQFQHEIWIYTRLNPMRRFIFIFKPEVGEYVLLRME